MSVENDIRALLQFTDELKHLIDQDQLEGFAEKEAIRKELLKVFFHRYTESELMSVADELRQLELASASIYQLAQAKFKELKRDVLKLRKSEKVKTAYK